MSRVKLQKLTLEAFRGAINPTTVEFDPTKHITMIYGENGTGKSSIVDGFSFLSEQEFGSLQDRSEANSDYITAITAKPENLRVSITTDKGTWQAGFKRNTKTIEVTPTTGVPPVRILRRKKILDLVDTPSSERYKALHNYIELPGVIKAETSLRDAVKTADQEAAEARRGLAQAQDALQKLWEQRGKPDDSPAQWAAQEKARDFSKTETQLGIADGVIEAINNLSDRKDDWSAAYEQREKLKQAHDKAVAALKQAESQTPGQSGDLVSLLQEAKTYVDATSSLQQCPVCERPIDAKKLSASLNNRMTSMRKVAELTTAVTQAKRKFDGQSTTVTAELDKYVKQIVRTATKLKSCGLQAVVAAKFPPGLLDILSKPDTTVNDRVTKVRTLEAMLPGIKVAVEKQAKTWRESLTLHATIVRDLDTFQAYEKQALERNTLWERLGKALKIVEEKRKEFVKQELAAISGEVERLFQFMHPGEKLGGIKLSLKDKFQHSLYLEGDFHSEKGITPQSLFSESHLDTLGLCVFLALAKKYRTEDTIIILDDIVTSVDHSHLSRFIDLLHDESEHFGHIIVTTHYGPWRDRYRTGRSPGGQLHFIELASWTLEKGIRPFKGKLRIDELKDVMGQEPFDRQAVASKAGILLEDVLDFLNRTYEAKLPLKNTPGYTLRELTDGFSSKFLKLLRIERFVEVAEGEKTVQQKVDVPLEPIINQAKGLAAVRNQVGCHYNELGSLCTEAEVRELGETALQLAEALVCPANGDFPTRDKSGSYWESRRGKVRLYPLAQPN
jgi:predicted ATPase